MLILGIETSCDETSAAVVEETGDAARPWAIRSNVDRVAGGDSPRVGRRRARARVAPAHPRHLRRRRARAGRRASRRGTISARSPSRRARASSDRCSSASSFAKAAAAAAGLPLVAVHHLAGHIESLVLQNGELPLPAVVLVVSGGHTSLYLVERPGPLSAAQPHARRCGGRGVRQGREAARARISGRAGRSIGSRATATIARSPLPTTRLTHADRNAPELKGDLDFSFSGLKTAVLRHVRERAARRGPRPLLRAGDRRHLRQLPARRRHGAHRSHVRRRAPVSGARASASPAACRPTAACARS